jgi:hypothetical protein
MAIFGGICNHTFNHEWNLHHWYSGALPQENTTPVEFWAQHHHDNSSSTLQ